MADDTPPLSPEARKRAFEDAVHYFTLMRDARITDYDAWLELLENRMRKAGVKTYKELFPDSTDSEEGLKQKLKDGVHQARLEMARILFETAQLPGDRAELDKLMRQTNTTTFKALFPNSRETEEQLKQQLEDGIRKTHIAMARTSFDRLTDGLTRIDSWEEWTASLAMHMKEGEIKTFKELFPESKKTEEELKAQLADARRETYRLHARSMFFGIAGNAYDVADSPESYVKLIRDTMAAVGIKDFRELLGSDHGFARGKSNDDLEAYVREQMTLATTLKKRQLAQSNLSRARGEFEKLGVAKTHDELETRLRSVQQYLEWAHKEEPSGGKMLLDKAGIASNEAMLKPYYDKIEAARAAAAPPENYSRAGFIDDYLTFRREFRKGVQAQESADDEKGAGNLKEAAKKQAEASESLQKAKGALKKLREDFQKKYTKDDKEEEWKRLFENTLHDRYNDFANPLGGKLSVSDKEIEDAACKLEAEALAELKKTLPAPKTTEPPGGMGSNATPWERAAQQARDALRDSSKLGIPRLTAKPDSGKQLA